MEYPEDIYDIIFKHIQKIKDCVNYSLINKKFYERYNKDLIKYKLELCMNKDYREVYNLLEKYKYDINSKYMKNIIKKSIKDMPTIWKNNVAGFYDMRYLFEIIYRYKIEDDLVKELNLHFHIHFFASLKSCIVKNNRNETIKNINKNRILSSLRKDFLIKENRHSNSKSKWIYLIE